LYEAHTYNFYICPKSFGDLDPNFLCQASSLEFLASHNFDFNKVEKREIQIERQIERQTDRQTEKLVCFCLKERQTDRQTDRQTILTLIR
jgi:hypothetical protein